MGSVGLDLTPSSSAGQQVMCPTSGLERRMTDIVVLPWIGAQYKTPRILKHRTMILGESNYTAPEKFTPMLVRDCVEDSITGKDKSGFGRFTTKIIRIIFGPDSKITPDELWQDVSFLNFVQPLVGPSARIRPTKQMWDSSRSIFEETVATLQPERILVLGIQNWRNVLRLVPHMAHGESKATFLLGGANPLAGYVQHPSSSLRYSEWNPVAQDLLLK